MKIDKDTCEEILVTITRNKTRSLLTAFGVFWGIFMLVALMGGGQGMEQELRKEFEGFATNSGFLFAQKTGEAYKGFRKGRSWDLEMADVKRIGKLSQIEISTPSVAQWGKTAIYEGNKYDCSVKGLYPDYEQIEHQEMAYGRFINDVDIREARKVCVIGKTIVDNLFPDGSDPIGRIIRFNQVPLRVVGVLKSKGYNSMGMDQDDVVLAPYTTVMKRLLAQTYLEGIFASAISEDMTDYATDEIFWSLTRIKQVGLRTVEYIVTERDRGGAYTGIENFIHRIFRYKLKKYSYWDDPDNAEEAVKVPVNARHVKHMILAGCFDRIEKVGAVTERCALLERAARELGFSLSEKDFPQDMRGRHFFWSQQQIAVSGASTTAASSTIRKPAGRSREKPPT